LRQRQLNEVIINNEAECRIAGFAGWSVVCCDKHFSDTHVKYTTQVMVHKILFKLSKTSSITAYILVVVVKVVKTYVIM
jgi:hypothetical protein